MYVCLFEIKVSYRIKCLWSFSAYMRQRTRSQNITTHHIPVCTWTQQIKKPLKSNCDLLFLVNWSCPYSSMLFDLCQANHAVAWMSWNSPSINGNRITRIAGIESETQIKQNQRRMSTWTGRPRHYTIAWLWLHTQFRSLNSGLQRKETPGLASPMWQL